MCYSARMTQVNGLLKTFPNPNHTGACTVSVTFACTGNGIERLNPLAMLPNPTVKAEYTFICQPCYDTLANIYMESAS